MNRELEELRKRLKEETSNEVFFTAIVTSINEGEDICEVDADGATYTDVKLRAVIDTLGNRIVIYPKKDTSVLCGRITNSNNIYIIHVSEIDKIYILIGETKVVLDKNGVVFNDGTNKGLVKAPKLVDRLNAIEKAFNELLNDYKKHNHVTPAGPSTVFVIPPVTIGTITTTVLGDIENIKVKH